MNRLILCLFLLVYIVGCDSKKYSDPELHHLTRLLSGSFSSKEQAKNEIGYAHANMVNEPIWKDRLGYWLYSETYNASDTSMVYMQRILHIQRLDSSTFKSTAYIIPGKEKYKNGWKNPKLFDKLALDSLQIRDGCDVLYKKKTSSIYVGKTHDLSCLSRLKNVAYTVSSIVLSKDQISVWDKGFDIDGKQVWGKIQGPYKYKRLTK